MRFSFDAGQLAMRDAVRAFRADRLALTDVAGREGKPASAELWTDLAELGVLGILADPDAGIGPVEAAIAFEELGAALAPGPLLWTVLAAPLVDGAADGRVRVAGVELTGRETGPIVVEHGDDADVLLVLREDGVELVPAADLPAARVGTPLDPLTPVALLPTVPAGRVVGDAAAARRLRRTGRVLAAAALVGVAQGALDTARAYALEREQFGVPIGSFQAVKHLLADMYVRLELARAATYAAAAVTADPRAGDPEHATAAAKLLAGEAGVGNGRTAIQVLGGMGFTWDMLPHYFLKRAWALEHCFGTAPVHASLLGTALGAETTPP